MTSITDSDPGGSAAPGPGTGERWTLALLVRRHKRASAVSLAVLVAMVVATIVPVLASHHRLTLTDASSCSQWVAATPALQHAYSHVYIDEYGRVANTAAHAAAVKSQINQACTEASYLGEADDVSVVAALKHAF